MAKREEAKRYGVLFSAYMKIFKAIVSVLISAVLLVPAFPAVYSEEVGTDFVDLAFTINSKLYLSKSIKKTSGTAPIIEKGVIMIPSDIILNELGCDFKVGKDSSITATRGGVTLKLQLNSKSATVNGVRKDMEAAPKKPRSGTAIFIPLRFTVRAFGAVDTWDETTDTVYVTRTGKFDTGVTMFYERSAKKSNIYVYNGKEIKTIPLVNREILNWYSYKGQVLATISDKKTGKNRFTIYKDGSFNVLIDDFEIKDTFEYNDNLVIHGYDRNKKINNLYRFDGKDLVKVQENFYVGRHILFKDKLVISKYDKNRDYTLLAFDKTSWKPGILAEGFVLKDYLEYDQNLYMTGRHQEGIARPLAIYNGNTIDSSSFRILTGDIELDVRNDIAIHNGVLYGVSRDNPWKDELVLIEKNSVIPVVFPYADSPLGKMKYVIRQVREYKGKLYIGTNGGKMLNASGRWVSIPDDKLPEQVLAFNEVTNFKILIPDFRLTGFRLENDRLLALGNEKVGTEKYMDPALYIHDGVEPVKTQDVLRIDNVTSSGSNIFIDVFDRDRIDDKERSTMLVYDNYDIKNLVVGMDTKRWDIIGKSLVFAGYEEDIKRNKLYSYNDEFAELRDNFEVKFWGKYNDILFVNGFNGEQKKYSFCRFSGNNLEDIRDNLEVYSIIKAKGPYFIVFACDKDPQSDFYKKKMLYIYDDSAGSFIEMKVDIELKDMIFVR